MMILLNAGADLASAVTVRGHDGSELALSQIPDIVRHVTGKTSGDFQFNKDSLYIYGAAPSYLHYMDFYSFNIDGSSKHQTGFIDNLDDVLASSDYQRVAAFPTSETIDDGDNRRLLLNFFVKPEDTALINVAVSVSGKADDENADIEDGACYQVGGIDGNVKGGFAG